MAANEDIRAERQRGPDPYDPDRFDGEPEDDFVDDEAPPRRSSRVLPIVVASLAIFGFVVIVYYAYQQGIRAGTEQNPPVIKAEEGPSKVRPASPGGMEVPNQGMKVYELGKSGTQQAAAPGGVERILPKAEEPMPRPPAPPEPATIAAPASAPQPGSSQASPSQSGPPSVPAASPSAPIAAQPPTPNAASVTPPSTGQSGAGQSTSGQASTVAPSTTSGVVVPPPPPLPGSGQPMPPLSETVPGSAAASKAGGPAVPSAPPPAQPPRDDAQAAAQPRGLMLGGRPPAGATLQQAPAAPASPPQAAQRAQTAAAAPVQAGGNAHVQLMAGKSAEEANAGWKQISARHKDLLGGLGMETQTVDIAGKGTFYRVLAGPVSKADAEKLCSALKGRGQDCIVR